MICFLKVYLSDFTLFGLAKAEKRIAPLCSALSLFSLCDWSLDLLVNKTSQSSLHESHSLSLAIIYLHISEIHSVYLSLPHILLKNNASSGMRLRMRYEAKS